ncbi:MAG TPA: sigma-54 dependent transcriptional regulator [Casimicrobiaceae bacterium]|nr:sigma-54 dependent transcriptional regulator [Casimicrobiaceae bacterium]
MFETTPTFSAESQILPPGAAPGSDLPRPKRRAHGRLQRLCDIYGACESMRSLFDTLDRVAGASATVIILGESGSGKELVANAIHQLSDRRQRPFIAINCGALPETLIESELFGHERGSFTGAARTHRGCFERANGGTLFLDEITEMPVDMQVRLLRVLESGRFSRIGGDAEIGADVRVIAASNRDLRGAVASGKLREDLMYRLCVIPVSVPPLRDRGDDAMLLAEMFLERLNDEHGSAKSFTAEARQSIAAYRWPGNVRELKNVIHRAYVLSDSEVDVDTGSEFIAPMAATAAQPRGDMASGNEVRIRVGTSLDSAERALIMATLRALDGSKSKAAHVLGISLKTLYNRLHAYGAGATLDALPAEADVRSDVRLAA